MNLWQDDRPVARLLSANLAWLQDFTLIILSLLSGQLCHQHLATSCSHTRAMLLLPVSCSTKRWPWCRICAATEAALVLHTKQQLLQPAGIRAVTLYFKLALGCIADM